MTLRLAAIALMTFGAGNMITQVIRGGNIYHAKAADHQCWWASAYPNPNGIGNKWPIPCDYSSDGPDPGAVYWEPRFPWNSNR